MRILVAISSDINEWHGAFAGNSSCPRLPLPYSMASAFHARGHEVSAINFWNKSFRSQDRGRFRTLYGPGQFQQALAENDIAFFWASTGIKAIASNLFRSQQSRQIILGSYVWEVPSTVSWKTKTLALATRSMCRFAKALVLMTGEQFVEAEKALGASTPVVTFTWGIDSHFYDSQTSEDEIDGEVRTHRNELFAEPYFVLAGDQLRQDADAVKLVEKYGMRLVRVPQERHTAEWYRNAIHERRLDGRLFVFERVNYPTLRLLLQHAVAYLGLVDSTWQPAGWTVMCESFASGTPVVAYEGFTTREMRAQGAGDFLVTTKSNDVAAIADQCQRLISRRVGEVPNSSAREFAQTVLDLGRTAPRFVECVESIVNGRNY